MGRKNMEEILEGAQKQLLKAYPKDRLIKMSDPSRLDKLLRTALTEGAKDTFTVETALKGIDIAKRLLKTLIEVLQEEDASTGEIVTAVANVFSVVYLAGTMDAKGPVVLASKASAIQLEQLYVADLVKFAIARKMGVDYDSLPLPGDD